MHPYFVCTTERSGSNMFCSYLFNTGYMGRPLAYLFNPVVWRHIGMTVKPLKELSDAAFLERYTLAERKTRSPNGVWGMKVFPHHREMFHRFLQLRSTSFHKYKWIWLRRRNTIRQAISKVMAMHTRQYHVSSADEPITFAPSLSPYDIIGYLAKQVVLDHVWECFFAQHNLSPHIVFYEDCEPMKPILIEIADRLDISIPRNVPIKTDFHKLNPATQDKLYDDFISSYSVL